MQESTNDHHDGHDVHHDGHDVHYDGHDVHYDGHDVHDDIRWQFTIDGNSQWTAIRNRRQFIIDGNPKCMTMYGNC